jgi:hypothetical protein
VRCEGVKFLSLYLKGSRRTLNLREGPLLRIGLVDYYPLRTDPNSWQDGYQNCASNAVAALYDYILHTTVRQS